MKIDASADILPNNGEALDEFASTFSRKNDDAMVINEEGSDVASVEGNAEMSRESKSCFLMMKYEFDVMISSGVNFYTI